MRQNYFSFLLLCGVFSSTISNANIGPEGFAAYPNKFFIETGSLGGSGIIRALAAGFKHVRSVEFDMANVRFCRERFKGDGRVTLYHGSSEALLWDMIKDITEPITFWLDAHIFPPLPGAKNCPLMEELDHIKKHPIKTHTILIDDMSCAGSESFDGISKDDLIAKIHEINPAYIISYIPGGNEGEYPDNIMVAQVP